MAEHRSRVRKVDPARLVAFQTLRAITGDGAYANLALADHLAGAKLSGRDAGFATELVFGTCRMLGSYDRIIERASGRGLTTLQPAVVDVLRLGAHQVLGMRVPAHAAVAASVDLAAARIGERVAGLVNAIIRKVTAKELTAWLNELAAGLAPHEALGIRYGHPTWIVDAYAEVLGEIELEAALAANNIPAVPTLVVRPGLAEVAELVDAGATPTLWSPWAATRAGNPGDLPAVREGRAGVQDEGSQLVCLAAQRAAPAGHRLDLCAGPGGKSALLRGTLPPGSLLVANELQQHRAILVARALRGYSDGHQVVCCDGTRPSWLPGSFALAVADVPCSGLGALRRRPEARWRNQQTIVANLATLQRDLLRSAISSVRPGGVVAYVTCSPHLAETIQVVSEVAAETGVQIQDAADLLPEVPDARHPADERFLQLWPHRHGTDAMFLALLRVPEPLPGGSESLE